MYLEIQSNGFFMIQKAGQQLYTRDGALQLSPSGTLQNASSNPILGFGVNATGKSDGVLAPVQIQTTNQPAHATTAVGLSAALNSGDAVPTTTPFNASNPATYNESTSVTAYDSLGNANRVQLYFANQGASGSTDSWKVYAQPEAASGSAIGTAGSLTTLTFNGSGQLTGGGSASLSGIAWPGGASPGSITFNFGGTTLGAQSFAVNGTTNDGYAPGQFTGTTISKTGAVQATYSNGQSKTVGQLALASFVNQQGLIPTSNNLFAASTTSGQPVVNAPGAGVNGNLVTGSLEQSNAQTASELVKLIQYQQQYQANTSVLQGEQQDTQRLIQVG